MISKYAALLYSIYDSFIVIIYFSSFCIYIYIYIYPNSLFPARDEIIRTNYKQYSLLDRYIDVLVADVTRAPFRVSEIFDAIITDRMYERTLDF